MTHCQTAMQRFMSAMDPADWSDPDVLARMRYLAEVELFENLAQMITDGQLPWRKSWITGVHTNAQSRRYGDVAQFMLGLHGRDGTRWFTKGQLERLGGTLCENPRAAVVEGVFGAPASSGQEGGLGVKRTLVFNIDDVRGGRLPQPRPQIHPKRPAPKPSAEGGLHPIDAVVQKLGIAICTGGDQPSYNLRTDEISMPRRERFSSDDRYYATLLHEICHWTGQRGRCNRTFGRRYQGDAYAVEELVAEFAASQLCLLYGVSPERDNQAAYLAGWAKAVREGADLMAVARDALAAIRWVRGEVRSQQGAAPKAAVEPGELSAPLNRQSQGRLDATAVVAPIG